MRKIYFLLFIAIIGLNFSSCKKDAVKEQPVILDVSGNWKLTSLGTDYIYGNDMVASLKDQPVDDYVDHIEFKSDGTGTMSVRGTVIRKFRYKAADLQIHYTDVLNATGNEWVGANNFMSFITKTDGTHLEFTDKVYIYTPVEYEDNRYDQIQRHIVVVKE